MDSLKNTIYKWALKVHVATNGAINFRCISCSLETAKKVYKDGSITSPLRLDFFLFFLFLFWERDSFWEFYVKPIWWKLKQYFENDPISFLKLCAYFLLQMKSKLHYYSMCHKETKKRTMQPYLKALKKVQCFIKGQWMTFCFLMPLMGFYNVATLPQTLLYPQYKVIYEKAKKGLVLRQRLRGRRRSHNSLPLKKAWLKTLFTMKSRKSLLIALPENWRPTISTGRPKSIFGARK